MKIISKCAPPQAREIAWGFWVHPGAGGALDGFVVRTIQPSLVF